MPQSPTNDNKPLQTPGRERNAAQPLDAAEDNAGAERYPEEARTFATDAPPGGHMGSGGDPSEGKRD